jgi:hypothetical protein
MFSILAHLANGAFHLVLLYAVAVVCLPSMLAVQSLAHLAKINQTWPGKSVSFKDKVFIQSRTW